MIYDAVRTTPFVIFSLLLSMLSARADKPMTIDARLGQPVMKSAETQRNFVRIDINGCERARSDRSPVNVAFVIDRSGSMQGARIEQAREAAIAALRRLNSRDTASVVAFDDAVNVVMPAQPADSPDRFISQIQQITTRGRTAIHAGVTTGAREVRRFKDDRRLNRIVLLSDGLANVGPSSPPEFASLGRDLLAEGISVSTIGLGLGYNEDLMLTLARSADGNHAFADDSADLVQIFTREFDDVLATCAQTVSVDVKFNPGIRPVRSLSREGTIDGRGMQFRFNQIYQSTAHYVLLEVEVDRSIAAGEQTLGHVRVSYTSPQDGERHALETDIRGRFSASKTAVTQSRDDKVYEAVVEQTARERMKTAINLRDKGQIDESRALFQQSATDIDAYLAMAASPSPHLKSLKGELNEISNTLSSAPARWIAQRKALRHLDAAPAGSAVRY